MKNKIKTDIGVSEFKKGSLYIDYDSNGNVIPWKEKKHQTVLYSAALEKVNDLFIKRGSPFPLVTEDQIERTRQCGEYREYKSYVNGETKDVMKTSLHRAFFCKRRLCPQCMWLHARTESYINALTLMRIHGDYKSAYGYFVTLTIKNVEGPLLEDAINKLTKGFTKLLRKRRIKKYLLGYSRFIEVTYNDESDTYHPHIHAVLIFKSSLRNSKGGIFKQSKKGGKNEFIDMWQEAADLDYRPSITIEQYSKPKKYIGKYGKHKGKLISKTREENIRSSAFELSKYTTEIVDVADVVPIYEKKNNKKKLIGYDYNYNVERLMYLENALFNKRLMTYGGLIKEYRKKIKSEILRDARIFEDRLSKGDDLEFEYEDSEGKFIKEKLTEEEILYNYFRVRYNHKSEYQEKGFVIQEIDKNLNRKEFERLYGYKDLNEEEEEELVFINKTR